MQKKEEDAKRRAAETKKKHEARLTVFKRGIRSASGRKAEDSGSGDREE